MWTPDGCAIYLNAPQSDRCAKRAAQRHQPKKTVSCAVLLQDHEPGPTDRMLKALRHKNRSDGMCIVSVLGDFNYRLLRPPIQSKMSKHRAIAPDGISSLHKPPRRVGFWHVVDFKLETRCRSGQNLLCLLWAVLRCLCTGYSVFISQYVYILLSIY